MQRILIFIVAIIAIVFFQIRLSKRKSEWQGLIFPGICLGLSFAAVGFMIGIPANNPADKLPAMLLVLMQANIPTVVLLGIYLGCRKGHERPTKITKND